MAKVEPERLRTLVARLQRAAPATTVQVPRLALVRLVERILEPGEASVLVEVLPETVQVRPADPLAMAPVERSLARVEAREAPTPVSAKTTKVVRAHATIWKESSGATMRTMAGTHANANR
jgi:hypothetical protein